MTVDNSNNLVKVDNLAKIATHSYIWMPLQIEPCIILSDNIWLSIICGSTLYTKNTEQLNERIAQ